MEKITRFRDIPQFTRVGNHECCYTLLTFVNYIEEEEKEYGLQLNPEFQRGYVWTEEQQIRWIEYHLRGGKSGNTVYLNDPFFQAWECAKEGDYKDYVCVDGLQRITAAKRFIHNEIPAFGTYYKDFTDKLRTLNCCIRVNTNNLKTEKEVLQWYIDMNDGGTPHAAEEIARVRALVAKLEEEEWTTLK
jgi:hypothetical protein